MALNSFAVFDALKDLSITEYTCYGDITDDVSLKENLRQKFIFVKQLGVNMNCPFHQEMYI